MRFIVSIAIVGMIVAATALPALANNDPLVPGNECSQNAVAVGQPGLGGLADGAQADLPFDGVANATDIGPSPVAGPASDNNPGQSDGAEGQANFDGGERC